MHGTCYAGKFSFLHEMRYCEGNRCQRFWQIMSVISFSEYKWIVYWRKHVGELFCCLFFSFIAGILVYEIRMHMCMKPNRKLFCSDPTYWHQFETQSNRNNNETQIHSHQYNCVCVCIMLINRSILSDSPMNIPTKCLNHSKYRFELSFDLPQKGKRCC